MDTEECPKTHPIELGLSILAATFIAWWLLFVAIASIHLIHLPSN